MAKYLKQSTASQEIPIGYMVDSTDGNTEETALTIANTDIKLWKNGATTLANKNSGGATHISNGIYYAVLDATDTNTLGPLKVLVHVSGALPFEDSYEVVTAARWDEIHSGTEMAKLARAAYLVDTTIATLASQTSFTLTAGSADDDAYNGMAFIFTDASTAVQKGVAFCSDYVGSTKTVTLEAGPAFTIATSDLVTVVPAGSSTSTPIPVNVTQISGDSTAADNLESYCDGTTPQPVNVTQISGDATAADNLESYTDGTTPIPANMTQISGDATAADNLESYTDGSAVIPANMEQINTVPITGNGQTGTEFSV